MSGVFSRRGSQQPPPPPPKPAEPDPSMEDILASIRRILNEGEGEAAAPAAEAAPVSPAAEAPPAPPEPAVAQTAPEPAQAASETPKETVKPDEVFVLDPAMMVNETPAADAPAAEAEAPALASTETVAAASQAVGALKKALSERHATIYKGPAVSIEEIVREEVRPLLKSWLDANLPSVVERLVRAEIERVVAREML